MDVGRPSQGRVLLSGPPEDASARCWNLESRGTSLRVMKRLPVGQEDLFYDQDLRGTCIGRALMIEGDRLVDSRQTGRAWPVP